MSGIPEDTTLEKEPKLTLRLESEASEKKDLGHPVIKVENDKSTNANKFANRLLAGRLLQKAAKQQKKLSLEACIKIIDDNEQMINDADPNQINKIFDDLLQNAPNDISIALQPDDTSTLDMAIAATNAADLDMAIAATDEADNDNKLIILPLRTSRKTLVDFGEYYTNKYQFQRDDHIFKKLNMESAFGYGPEWDLFSSNDYVIRNMDFHMYWELRDFQITRMEEELKELLHLAKDENGNFYKEKGLMGKFLHAAGQFIREPLSKTLNEDEQIKYAQQMLEFLEGVHIELETNPQTQQQEAHIKKKYGDDDIDLVTIIENTNNGLGNMEFSINPELLKDKNPPDPDRGKKLADAIELSIDQATRLLERNQDKKHRLHIEGYEDSPEMVLRIFYSAKLHGHSPTIDENTTLQFWQNKVQSGTAAEKERYQKAIDLYNELNNPDLKIKDLKNYEDHRIFKQLGKHQATKAAGKSSSNATATPTINPKKPT